MRSTRYILGAVLAIGFAAASVRAADVEPLLPASTEQVVHVNVKQILGSDVIKKFAMDKIKETLSEDSTKEILKELGLDPLKDIDTITLGIWGSTQDDMNTVAVIHGTFDAKKMFAAAEKYSKDNGDKLSIVEEGKFKLIKIIGNNDKPMYAAVADDKTIVLANEKKFTAAALTASIDKAKPALNKELAATVAKQDAKASMFACFITDGKFKDVNIPDAPLNLYDPEKVKNGLLKMDTATVVVRLGTEISLDLAMGMKDADSAKDFGGTIAKVLDTVKPLLPLAAMNNAKVAPLIDEITKSLESAVSKKQITLTVKVTADAISKATGMEDK